MFAQMCCTVWSYNDCVYVDAAPNEWHTSDCPNWPLQLDITMNNICMTREPWCKTIPALRPIGIMVRAKCQSSPQTHPIQTRERDTYRQQKDANNEISATKPWLFTPSPSHDPKGSHSSLALHLLYLHLVGGPVSLLPQSNACHELAEEIISRAGEDRFGVWWLEGASEVLQSWPSSWFGEQR